MSEPESPRTPRVVDLTFRPLTPDLWPRFADWFGSPDSSSDARWCWCAFWRQRGLDWSNATPESNRALLHGLAEREGPAPGLVAFRGDRAVGWVSVSPRETYDRLEHSRVLARVDDRPVWSIVCFVVARTERGRGVATALLDAAVAYAREHGATLVEAYPADTTGGRIPAASAYGGPLSMFQRAGFELAATRRANAATRPRAIVRRELEGTPGESA